MIEMSRTRFVVGGGGVGCPASMLFLLLFLECRRQNLGGAALGRPLHAALFG